MRLVEFATEVMLMRVPKLPKIYRTVKQKQKRKDLQ